MSNSNQNYFDVAFTFAVGVEGSYSNDPNDPGNWTGGQVGVGSLNGTAWGISASQYPNLNIQSLTLAQAQQIYLTDYWNLMGCNQIDGLLALEMFDCGVNEGQPTSVKILQSIIGSTQDGLFGPNTLAAYNSYISQYDNQLGVGRGLLSLHVRFISRRLSKYTSDPDWNLYGQGWMNRISQLEENIGIQT